MQYVPLLRGDKRKTMQIVLNLVTNAIKFSEAGGRVQIACRADEREGLSITVSDTGIGIASDDLGRVLEAFEQVDSSFPANSKAPALACRWCGR